MSQRFCTCLQRAARIEQARYLPTRTLLRHTGSSRRLFSSTSLLSQSTPVTEQSLNDAKPASRPRSNRKSAYIQSKESLNKQIKWRLLFGAVFLPILCYDMLTGDIASFDSDNVPVPPPNATKPTLYEVDEITKQRTQIDKYSPMRLRMEQLIREHQKQIVFALEQIDGKEFLRDEWKRETGQGGGISCVLQDGNVFEKAGVNISVIYGTLPRAGIEKMRADHKSFVGTDVESLDYFVGGLSIVIHPKNPKAPTAHLNYRYFETSDPNDPVNALGRSAHNWWFGGGCDLTPAYLFPEDAEHFHKTIKAACDKHDKQYYPQFKAWCDKYFYLPHRKEARGVGGIFFDDLDASTRPNSKNPQEDIFQFVKSCLESFLPAYIPIMKRRKDMEFTEENKHWQQLRRGRYVEFNLLTDRGTAFGLRTPNARIESILMSLPLTARWEYMHPIGGTGVKPTAESEDPESFPEEKALLDVLKNPREWA